MIDKYKLQIMTGSPFTCASGGWIPSSSWSNRSPVENSDYYWYCTGLDGTNDYWRAGYPTNINGICLCYSI